MRVSKASGWCASLVAMAAALVALSTATDARADAEFTATGGVGKITVTGNGPWHINKDGPWKATVGSTTLDSARAAMAERRGTNMRFIWNAPLEFVCAVRADQEIELQPHREIRTQRRAGRAGGWPPKTGNRERRRRGSR